MNLNNTIIKITRKILLPISVLYGFILKCRYWLYKNNFFRSASLAVPSICVGNLSVGGTGKTPMVLFLMEQFKNQFKIATISRGYKRTTKGYLKASPTANANTMGDEPYLFYKKHPNNAIVVCEDRLFGYTQLMSELPDTNLVIFDDALQHRGIAAKLNICLTTYNDLFVNDYYLPSGNLRDHKVSAERCNIIVVTKCPETLSLKEANEIKAKLKTPINEVFFSAINYNNIYAPFSNNNNLDVSTLKDVFLCTGIANALPLKNYLQANKIRVTHYAFADHFKYTKAAIEKIIANANGLPILTTEKDMVKLFAFEDILKNYPLFVLPISLEILFNQQQEFITLLKNSITKN